LFVFIRNAACQALVIVMPVDLPPQHTPNPTGAASVKKLSGQILNWVAVAIGIGLCIWALQYGLSSPSYVNSPSLSALSPANAPAPDRL
jgi:hypothetical protein